MLKIERAGKSLKQLNLKKMAEVGLLERQDIQQMIRNCSKAFFSEMGEELLLVGEEVRPDDFVDDRIDLLALDRLGATVIIEIKRGNHKMQLLQALTYASMVSKWEKERVIEERLKLAGGKPESVEEEIEQFLLGDVESINQAQRIILLAEDFDYEVLVTAEWLTESYEMDVRCYRLTLSEDASGEFLSCTCIYPPPEITKHAIRRKTRSEFTEAKWTDWKEAVASIENKAVAAFFESELKASQENKLGRRRSLYYRQGTRRRFNVVARQKLAYVWQRGRFKGDDDFWNREIGPQAEAEPVNDGKALRFYLSSSEDFSRFSKIIREKIENLEFIDANEGELESEET